MTEQTPENETVIETTEVTTNNPQVQQTYDPSQQAYNQAPQYQQPQYQQPQYAQQPQVVDSGSIGWGILGFFFPIVGLILFLVWKNTKPKSAKVSGIGALIGFVFNIILSAGSTVVFGSLY